MRCFAPNDHRVSRLVRSKQGNNDPVICVFSTPSGREDNLQKISASFSKKTSKWDAVVIGESGWEKQRGDLSSIFIPAK